MPDLGRRLQEELNMVPDDVQWVTAWSIRSRDLDSKSFPMLKALAEVSCWPLNRYETLALLIFSSVLAVDLWLLIGHLLLVLGLTTLLVQFNYHDGVTEK
jgi:hypothetical protein